MVALRVWRMSLLGAVLVASATGCGRSKSFAPETGGTAAVAGVAGVAGDGQAHGGDGGIAGATGGSAGTAGATSEVAGGTSGIAGTAGATNGIGGTAGTAGVAGTGECGLRDVVPPFLSSGTLEPDGVELEPLYDGPAIVERSTERELLLSIEQESGDVTTLHVGLTGLTPMPLLARGTKLWLAKNPLPDPPFSFVDAPAVSVSVRDVQDGTLLFGAAYEDFSSVASPVGISDVTPLCTVPTSNTCLLGGTVTYSSVTVAGDTPVVVKDGESGVIALNGEPYDVWVTAREEKADGLASCPDYLPVSGVAVYVQSARLAELVPTLEVGPGPACGHGNDPDVSLYFGFYGASTGMMHEGVVTYAGPDIDRPDAYVFEVPGLVSFTEKPVMLSIAGAVALMPEPELGQEFWLSFPGPDAHALRESEGGPVVLAQSWGGQGYDAAGTLGNLLGVEVSLEETCAYAPPIPLLETVFATEPEVRVASGTTETLVIGGRTYRVWALGQGFGIATIYLVN
jgi:hypothetical protein